MATRGARGKRSAAGSRTKTDRDGGRWTFLSNHTHVLICLHREPELTLREVAQRVGITERSVQRILGELEDGGYLQRERQGLRNHYRFRDSVHLRHPIEQHVRVGDLIALIDGSGA